MTDTYETAKALRVDEFGREVRRCPICQHEYGAEKQYHKAVCGKCAIWVANWYNKEHCGSFLTWPEPAAPEPPAYKKAPIPEGLRWAVFERDNYTCRDCGSRQFLRADHIYPERHGGVTTLENLQTLCQSCNSKKRDKVPE